MKKRYGVFALALLIAAPAFAEAVHHPPQVTGKRARKNIRHHNYFRNLENDKKAIYEQYGFTAHRVRLNEYGLVREQWTYFEEGREFVFDTCGRLVEERSIPIEKRRAWAYQRDVRGYDEDVCCDD